MAANDDKKFDLPLITPVGKEKFLEDPSRWLGNTFGVVNDVLRKIQSSLHTLEGRNGKISLRDSLGVYGGVSVGTTYTTSDAPSNGMLVEGSVGIGTTDPKAPLDVMSAATGAGVAKEVLALSRQRGDTGAPGRDFGCYVTYRLEGFTERTNILAGKVLCAWDKAQTNNTTDADSYIAFSVALDGSLTEVARLTSSGIATTVAVSIQGLNGESETAGYTTESITIAAAASTDSTANLLPANSILQGVAIRVTTAIPMLGADFTVGDASSASRFASGVSKAVGTTAVGIRHHRGSVAADADGPTQTAAAKVRITPASTPSSGTGVVRVTVFYRVYAAPTS